MNYSTEYMTVADFMEFVAPTLPPGSTGVSCKVMMKGPAWTVRKDGNIICCYGFAPMMRGCAEAWMVMSPEGKVSPLMALRYAKQVIGTIMQAGLFRRVQAVGEEGQAGHRDWVEHLGVKIEGVMLKYGPNGETYLRFVMFS